MISGAREGSLEADRLGRFFPALLTLTVLAGGLEAVAALILRQPAFATAAGTTALFAIGVTVAGYQVRIGRPVGARLALAISLTAFGAVGAYLIPGVGDATALLPVLSVILVLPHVPRKALPLAIGLAVAAAVGTLILDETAAQAAAIPGLAGVIFRDGILVGVLILVLAGLADSAMAARDSLRNLEEAAQRQLQATTSRLSIMAALRVLHALPTPEATAKHIATALASLPRAGLALVLEATDDGLSLLAAAGEGMEAADLGKTLSPDRAAYLLERSRGGPWAERWADRPERAPGEEDVAYLGIEAQAYAPIHAGDRVVGLVVIATMDADQAVHLVADLPSVGEAAAVAGTILAPGLLARRQLRLAKLRIAETIASGAFRPVFQPIIDLGTGLTVGFEVLTRFASGDAPDVVFADAAKVGLGPELEAATLAAGIRDAVRLPSEAWLSLNVSPGFLGDPTRLLALLAHRTRPITLEITEHDLVDDYAPIHAAMRILGPDVRLAVDDAGAGVANFRHLVELRPAVVKIDAGLIRGVNADVSRQALVVGLVHFAAASGAIVLAEGIETEAEQETVERLGVSLGQGYRLGRPAPVDTWARLPAGGLRPPLPGNVVPIRRLA